MIFNERAVPPAFIVDAISGAPALREEVEAARGHISEKGRAMREAGDRLREKVSGPLEELTPRRGVTAAEAAEVEDAYRHAVEASESAQRAHKTALARLHATVRDGMQTEGFKASHEQLADAAHIRAVRAGVELFQALKDRDDFDAAIGRKRDPNAAAPHDRRYYFRGIEKLINARIMSFHQGLVDTLDSSTMTAAERVEFAKRNGMIAV